MRWLIVLKFVLLLSCSFNSVAVTPTAIDAQLSVKSEDASSPFTQSRKFSKGEALYIQSCADCHGWEGRGSGQAARYLDVPTPILLNNELLAEKSEKQFVDWVLSGKALTLQLKENSILQTDTEVNALLAHIKKLPSIKWNEIEAGQETYDALCINCHGLYGHGDGSLASKMPGPLPDLNSPDFQTRRSDEELLKIITKGKDAMPGAENVLTPKEIKTVIAYLRLLSPGYESYDRFCANCHGANGIPIEIVTVTEDEKGNAEFGSIDLLSFDTDYINTHEDKQLIPKIKHMLESHRSTMPHFAGHLKPGEAREIFRYLSDLLKEYP